MMIQMAESGLLPDGLVRFGIRRLLGQRKLLMRQSRQCKLRFFTGVFIFGPSMA